MSERRPTTGRWVAWFPHTYGKGGKGTYMHAYILFPTVWWTFNMVLSHHIVVPTPPPSVSRTLLILQNSVPVTQWCPINHPALAFYSLPVTMKWWLGVPHATGIAATPCPLGFGLFLGLYVILLNLQNHSWTQLKCTVTDVCDWHCPEDVDESDKERDTWPSLDHHARCSVGCISQTGSDCDSQSTNEKRVSEEQWVWTGPLSHALFPLCFPRELLSLADTSLFGFS